MISEGARCTMHVISQMLLNSIQAVIVAAIARADSESVLRLCMVCCVAFASCLLFFKATIVASTCLTTWCRLTMPRINVQYLLKQGNRIRALWEFIFNRQFPPQMCRCPQQNCWATAKRGTRRYSRMWHSVLYYDSDVEAKTRKPALVNYFQSWRLSQHLYSLYNCLVS